MPSQRIRQINSLLRDYFATAFMRLLELPTGVVVSVTKVHTTADLHFCTVFLSIIPDTQTGSVLQLIRQNSNTIIEDVVDRITFRSIPRFKFVLDDTERKAQDIEQLLDRLKETE